MPDLFNYLRRTSSVTCIGDTPMGGAYPIRVQSMTTTDTNDTEASVAQTERIADAGGEYVRLTTQGTREAENLKAIGMRLRADGYATPLIADVHFNARVADVAAHYAQKVRINPGNYVDPARTFKTLDYTDEEYAKEIEKIEQRFVPFLHICKEHHTAVRIGVNHGSLSDRIMSRYGDTPAGIVESCMEFLRICKREHFDDVVISIKASNTVVMVRSVRLLVSEMEKEGMHYPLHLGVTEAGEGEDGRIKSAVGIGALLADGIGDTIRVSLSEEPEAETPVARRLVEYITQRAGHSMIPCEPFTGFDYLQPEPRETHGIDIVGGQSLPVVIVSEMGLNDRPSAFEAPQVPLPDFIYTGASLPERRRKGQKYIVDFNAYHGETDTYPIFPHTAMPFIASVNAPMKFLVLQFGVSEEEYTACLKAHPEVVVVCMSNHSNRLGHQRALVHEMMAHGLKNPVIFSEAYRHSKEEKEDFQLEAAADTGALMIDGFCNGLWLMNDGNLPATDLVTTALGILQAGRLRTSKTEYISCPGCGRTLYDLRSTIARIKAATSDMAGLKIGIMGCIVNGPGEMADADYGYVGAGPHRVSLYRKKECVQRSIPEEEAVDRLLELIRSDRQKLP